ncbi:MAG: polymer-forming cytoskeletal protein [Myxococcales bacterium]
MAEKAARARGTTILAEGCALEGELRVRGEAVIEGAVVGNVVTEGTIAIGPQGRVLGEVIANELSVRGRVDGIVRARGHLRVLSSGHVEGHATYDSLEVERGGIIQGSSYQALPGVPSDSDD